MDRSKFDDGTDRAWTTQFRGAGVCDAVVAVGELESVREDAPRCAIVAKIAGMAEANVAPGAQIESVLRTLSAVEWPVATSGIPELISSLGWSVVPGTENGYLKADTGFGISRREADFSCHDDTLTSVSFRVSDVVVEETPWRADFLTDAFAATVDSAATALGRPSSRAKGGRPKAIWDLPSGARITISRAAASVSIDVDSARYADALRTLSS